MKKRPTSRLQLSYIISYMLIFIVPFSIISLIFYFNSVNSLREEIEISHINNLKNIKNIVDDRMKELNNIGALISYDPKLSPYRVSLNQFRPEAIDELKKYKENSAIIDDLYLYYFKQNEIFSTNGHMSVNTFLEYQSNVQIAEKDVFMNNLRDINIPGISTSVNIFDNNNPTFLYPLPPGPVSSFGVVFMKLEDTFFKNMINNILGSYEGIVLIFDQENKVIATYSNESEKLKVADVKSILDKNGTISELNINKVNYSVLKVKSETSQWSYVTALPTKQFFSKVSEFKTFMLLILLFIAIVATFLTIYIALRQYHPIEKMLDTVKRKDTSYPVSNKNELDNMRIIIENLYAQHEDLNNKFEKQEPLVRDQCLITLLQGHMKAVNQSKELFQSLNLTFTGNYSFVFVTSFSKEQLSDIDMRELELASSQLLRNAKLYSVELINEKVVAYIINGNVSKKGENQKFLSQFMQLLMANDKNLCIGVGKTYKGKEFINRSFIEASAAFEHGISNQISGVILFDEIKEQQETMWLPKTDLLKLTQSCKQGNVEIATEAVKLLTTWLSERNAPIHLIKHMQYDIINTIIKTASETGISINLKKASYQLDVTSIRQFEIDLIELVKEICIEISKKKENQKSQLQFDILKYIHDHFQDYTLSLENMAQNFNLSASYLSRFIKDETQKTFSQYVWELRLTEVKKQLTETNSPIKQIISDVGYIDAPNFTRKFKNSVGLTPSEYRNIHAKHSKLS
ncbi:helix-turn-helix domain-containing protein [Lederbergia lenta]|uniref:AraC family transcriptional regulator n=1 Tax=Lederbergia lenta TaxID=1467 RepID=A0A2X4W113_LEDLE|nr:helix-turn-helix domain-containing protein [Lederbergia lenta]MCM3110842.1 AraC family transcriptional regulator [Lederbergia lenta]MEC2325763.1 AraC family transcriptional regulator [Lederbergia lenta]SQI53788.1 AraC family transcriptional regulator [Lederbergia lenta]